MKKKTKNDLTLVQFVVRKNPNGIIVRQLADGTTKIIIEVTQDEMNSAVDSAIEKLDNHGNSNPN